MIIIAFASVAIGKKIALNVSTLLFDTESCVLFCGQHVD